VIVLIGFMGAGKTTVGRLLAPRLGLPFVDTDALIETRTGASVAEIFESKGEGAFREIEREVVAEVLAGPDAVVALGGGAVNDPVTCVALEWTTVVYLDAPYSESMHRIGADPGRPLLTIADPRALYEERKVSYEGLADATVDTSARAPEAIVQEVMLRLAPEEDESARFRRVVVPLADRRYEVVVGAGVLAALDSLLPPSDDAEKAFVIAHRGVVDDALNTLRAALERRGLEPHLLDPPSGEESKSLTTVEALYTELAERRAHRHDLVIGLGGGVITDVAGFVASTFNRGMPLVHVPTTLLGQVDAAIGGKTGVNLPHAKNLVGTVYQPALVICDVELLRGLPHEELRSGLAEVTKYGFIAEPSLLDFVEQRAVELLAGDADALVDVVARSAAIKAEVVAADEFETGERAILNYGHTFAHAIEQTAGYGRIRHGEAVGLGMMAAAYLARELGRIGDEVVERHRRVLDTLGLPNRAELDIDVLEPTWQHDKKYRGGVRFVLLAEIGKADYGIEAPREMVARALERLKR